MRVSESVPVSYVQSHPLESMTRFLRHANDTLKKYSSHPLAHRYGNDVTKFSYKRHDNPLQIRNSCK